MGLNAEGLDAATRAAACAASLLLATLAQGCARANDANGGAASSPPAQAALAAPSPAQTARPNATPSSGAQIADSPLPAPKGFVNDFADVIDAGAEERLEATLKRLKERANVELAIATVETTGGRDINDYSLAVARGWGVGPPAGQGGGGLLLLLAVKDRKWRIQVSRSLEADLPDDVTARIGEQMARVLRTEQYAEAFGVCVEGLVKRLAERRGLSSHDVQWILLPSPAASPQPSGASKGASRGAA